MRLSGIVLLTALLAGAATPLAAAAELNLDELVKEFRGQADAQQRDPAALQAAYAFVIDKLLPDMGSDDLGKRGNAQTTFEDIAFRASRPGADAQRDALAKAIAAKLPAAPNVEAKVWLIRQLQYVGRAECVPALAAALADKEARVRECARRALQRNSSDEAAAALRDALAKADSPEWRVALINAVAGRNDTKGTSAIAKHLEDSNESVAMAAAAGLGRLGGAQAAQALAQARKKARGAMELVVIDSYLLCADQMAAAGDTAGACRIYNEMRAPANPERFRMAGLRGIVAAQGEKAVPVLTDVLSGTDAAMRAFALSLVSDIPGTPATKAFVAVLPKLGPAEKAALLTEFGSRGDAAAKPAVIEALKTGDEAIRAAAVSAMASLGDVNDVPMLAKMAADADGKERESILGSLVLLRGEKVDAAILAAMKTGKPDLRIQLIRALTARRAKAAVPDLVKTLADGDGGVRVETARALGVLGDATALEGLAARLGADSEDERTIAQQAIGLICGRTADKDACAAPLLAAYTASKGTARASLVQALASTGTAKALAAVRGALRSGDEPVKEAAIRSLADWPDDAPAADLLAVAKTAPKATHQVLALRGYVRLAGLGKRPDADTVAMYQQALGAAKRPQEKKIVLSAMTESASLATLKLAQSLMANADLKAEAAVATAKIARAISGGYPDDARAAVNRILAEATDDGAKRVAQETLNFLERFEDYVTAWMVSGPYAKGKVWETAYPPEQGDGSEAQWKPVPPAPGDQPWRVDFGRVLGAGENCCAYLRTYIFSDKDQDARFEIGTDDGVKVWLGGKVVHANNTTRGFSPAQDIVKVTLKKGCNPMLMKVTQGGGGWEACARVRAPTGGKLEGISFRPKPE